MNEQDKQEKTQKVCNLVYITADNKNRNQNKNIKLEQTTVAN